MHILVTGGAGFIGSHLTDELLKNDHEITVVDNFSTGSLKNIYFHPKLKLLAKDILTCQVEDFRKPVDAIVHLAATASVNVSWENPLTAHHNNLSATVWIIELCQRLKIPRLIYASSAAVYGNQSHIPISESSTTQPIAPYGWQKLFGEQYASLFAERAGFSFIGLRFFNVFGERQLPDSSYSGVISIFVNAMKNNLPITIYGDGTQTRDFIYVKDVVAALSQSLMINLNSSSSLICNIGTGQQTSLLQLIDYLNQYFPDWNKAIKFEPSRIGDIQHSQANIKKAEMYLSFQTQWSIETALERTIFCDY